MGRRVLDFWRREDGVVAVIFAVMAIPFIAMAGWAVDYLRLQHVRETLQVRVDMAALSARAEEGRTPDQQWDLVETATRAEIERNYDGRWARDIEITHERSDNLETVRVSASADVPLAFIHLMPGIPETQRVSVTAVAQFFEAREIRQPPDTSLLDPEAGDFNRIWAYCYWPNRWEHGELPRRTRMVPIADNGGSVFNPDFSEPPTTPGLVSDYNSKITANTIFGLDAFEYGPYRIASQNSGGGGRTYEYMWPNCEAGSYLSFRLENVRFARTEPRYWDTGTRPNGGGDRLTGRFDYYTDTYFEDGSIVEQYDGLHGPQPYVPAGQKVDILETVLCDSLEECRPVSQGGIIPEGRNRTPQRATGGCEPGKYMYYGWEDRPPGFSGQSRDWQDIAWTDRDYDDIRIIIQCPTFEIVGDRNARLIG